MNLDCVSFYINLQGAVMQLYSCIFSKFSKLPYNWENWEIFANFELTNFQTWISDSWQNFEWNFCATHIWCLVTLIGPGGQWGHLTPEHWLYQISTRNCARNKNILFKNFDTQNQPKFLSFLSFEGFPLFFWIWKFKRQEVFGLKMLTQLESFLDASRPPGGSNGGQLYINVL